MKEKKHTKAMIDTPRVEIVDNWHKRWPLVLQMIKRLGQRSVLKLDQDAWLSARQSVVVAFVGNRPVGHLCFHIHAVDRNYIEARLDAIGIDQNAAGRVTLEEISFALRDAAYQHGLELHCNEFKGLDSEPATFGS